MGKHRKKKKSEKLFNAEQAELSTEIKGKEKQKSFTNSESDSKIIFSEQSSSKFPENIFVTSMRRRKKEMSPQHESDDDQIELISVKDVDSNIKSRVEDGDGLFEEHTTDSTMLIKPTEEYDKTTIIQSESSLTIFIQVVIPFLVAGLGMVGAGIVLDVVQHWQVFVAVTDLFIIVPALLGLKGNLEMTLASRLSTHANLGHMDQANECLSMIIANLALIQCQAIVVGFLSSLVAIGMGFASSWSIDFQHCFLLIGAALVTASFASFILGLVMVGVILLSRYCNINPDNVATPIAASLGDLTTLGLLAWIASLLYASKGTSTWLAPTIIVLYTLSTPVWVWLSYKNCHTKKILLNGWTPVISAMLISSMGGVILDFAVSTYKGIAVYQPVINGVGGNLVAIQASRLSTYLHSVTRPGVLPKNFQKACQNPFNVFCSKDQSSVSARVLLYLAIPGHVIFIFFISYFKAGHTSLTWIFVLAYLSAAFFQVLILLYVARIMIQFMWSKEIDPDNHSIPYLTALGDLIGTSFLALSFHLLYLAGDRDADLGD